jgi:hypothetical protein
MGGLTQAMMIRPGGRGGGHDCTGVYRNAGLPAIRGGMQGKIDGMAA